MYVDQKRFPAISKSLRLRTGDLLYRIRLKFHTSLQRALEPPPTLIPSLTRPGSSGSRNRGMHILLMDEKGRIKCRACRLCEAVCPTGSISVEAGKDPDPEISRSPDRFEIDLLRCIFCGLCTEACPCDALRMDVGHSPPSGPRRSDFIHTREILVGRSGKEAP